MTCPEGAGPSALVRTNITDSTRASEQPDSNNTGNQNELDDANEEIATNYAESRNLYNRKTTIVDTKFVAEIVIVVDEDLEPKSMAECRKCSDMSQMERNDRDRIALA